MKTFKKIYCGEFFNSTAHDLLLNHEYSKLNYLINMEEYYFPVRWWAKVALFGVGPVFISTHKQYSKYINNNTIVSILSFSTTVVVGLTCMVGFIKLA